MQNAASEKYESWKWEIQLTYLPQAKVTFWWRMNMGCQWQNQWVNKSEMAHVAQGGVDESNKHPTDPAWSKLPVLGGRKEKFPAYRGSVVPTHIEEWVGEPDYFSSPSVIVRHAADNLHFLCQLYTSQNLPWTFTLTSGKSPCTVHLRSIL